MDPIARKNAVKTTVVQGGQSNVSRAGAGGTKNEVKRQEQSANAEPAIKQTTTTTDRFGVQTSVAPDGAVSKKTASGVGLEQATDGSRTLSFTDTGDSFKLEGDTVKVAAGEARDVRLETNSEGIELVSFVDKGGHQVRVDPESLIYEVINKRGDTAQVFHPDGSQGVIAWGTVRHADGRHQEYEKQALFDPEGGLLHNEGFEGLEARQGKISFDLGEGRATRSLARPLPGQAPLEETGSQAPAKPAASAAPTALLAETPDLLTLPSGQQHGNLGATPEEPAVPTSSQPQGGPEPAAFPGLPPYQPGFFDHGQSSETVLMAETKSGVVMREEAGTRSFALPNGDMFRTDGEKVEVLGDAPRAKNARMVVEDGMQLLAYRDKNRNSYQLNVNTGDLTVSNSNGTLKQTFLADGSQEFEARSTHTTEAGSKEHSFHKATFGADGTLVERQGFDGLEVGEKSIVHTLANGEVSVRNLMEPTNVRYREPKPAAADVLDGWGDAQGAVDSILGRVSRPQDSSPVQETVVPPTVEGAVPLDEVEDAGSFSKPQFARSGVSRTTLPDGSVMTRLPNGIAFTDDGEKPFAVDPDGNRLEVIKRDVPTDAGYILYTKSREGVGYTIAPDHLDMLVESKDGKVHQMVTESGYIDTHIKDGKNVHTHQLDTNRMQQVATPGVRSDFRTPDRLYIDSPDNRSYELPHPLPTSPAGPQPWGPGGAVPVQHGVKPSMWERMKSVFTGENPWEDPSVQGPQPGGPVPHGAPAHHGAPPYMGGMPGAHYRCDPIERQMMEMERMNRAMNTMTMVTMGVSALSMLSYPSLMFPFGGFYF